MRLVLLVMACLLMQAQQAPLPPVTDADVLPVFKSSAEPPALTNVAKFKLISLAQRMEIAQLKAAAATHDFNEAKDELMKLLKQTEVEGYTLNLDTLAYVKDEKSKPK
jgi:hypothetical protein